MFLKRAHAFNENQPLLTRTESGIPVRVNTGTRVKECNLDSYFELIVPEIAGF